MSVLRNDDSQVSTFGVDTLEPGKIYIFYTDNEKPFQYLFDGERPYHNIIKINMIWVDVNEFIDYLTELNSDKPIVILFNNDEPTEDTDYDNAVIGSFFQYCINYAIEDKTESLNLTKYNNTPFDEKRLIWVEGYLEDDVPQFYIYDNELEEE